jgi:hypothetical protein
LHLIRIEAQQPHQAFIRQQDVLGGQHALHAPDATHNREQHEIEERDQGSLTVVRIQGFQERPGADLTDVLEQLVEESRFVQGMDTIDRSALVHFQRHPPVVPGGCPPARNLSQTGP